MAIPAFQPLDISAEVAFRERLGLRSDSDWVLRVVADPASDAGKERYGVALLPSEVAELDGRARNADEVRVIVNSYGARHRAEFAGGFLDHAGGGVYVAFFTRRLAEHEAGLRPLLSPTASLELRPARWTLEELRRFEARLYAEEPWLVSVGADLSYTSLLVADNVVEAVIASSSLDAGDLLAERFGDPSWLRIVLTSGAWTGPTGNLVIQAVDADGKPLMRDNLACSATPDVPDAYGDPALLLTTDASGRCEIEGVGAVHFRVALEARDGDAWVVVGEGEATVPPDGIGTAEVLVRDP